MASEQRINTFAHDLYELAGAFITANQLRGYLGCGRNTAERILRPLIPVYNAAYKKYYYRDVAERLAEGEL